MVIGSLVVYIAGPSLEIPESTLEFQQWLQQFGRYAWAVGGATILGDALLPLPSDPAIFTLGLIYGGLIGGLVGGTAATLAGLIGYGIARALGEKGAAFLVGEKDLARAENFYARWGFAAVALGRAIGGPAEYLVVVAGLTDMPFRRVATAIVCGAYPAAFCIASLGAYSIANPTVAVALAVTLVLCLMGGFQLIRRRYENETDA